MEKQTHRSLLAMIVGHPMMIDRPGLDMILTIAARETITPEMLEQYPGKYVEKSTGLMQRGDVGIIPVQGPIFRHATMFDRISGATTTETIAEDLGVALNDSTIKSIVLKINSPGGEAASIGELAGMIRTADSQKPVTTYFDFYGTSAAYYLGVAAGKTVANKASFVGSIGTISAWTSTKQAKEMLGLKDIVVVSPQSPKKGIDPESEEGLKELQDHLAFLTDHFVDDVSMYTGKSRKRVLEDFGQGGVVNSTKAIEVGMVDDLGTFEQVVARVSGGKRYRPTRSTPVGSVGSNGGSTMGRLGDWFAEKLGFDPNMEIPEKGPAAHGAESAPLLESRGSQEDADDPRELKRQLIEERTRREKAEAKAHADAIASENAQIEATVKGWTGRHIHPHEFKAQLSHCLLLASTDRGQNLTGDASLLASHRKLVESRKLDSLTEESVVNQRVPDGGTREKPPVAPDPPQSADRWADDRKALQADLAKQFANGRK